LSSRPESEPPKVLFRGEVAEIRTSIVEEINGRVTFRLSSAEQEWSFEVERRELKPTPGGIGALLTTKKRDNPPPFSFDEEVYARGVAENVAEVLQDKQALSQIHLDRILRSVRGGQESIELQSISQVLVIPEREDITKVKVRLYQFSISSDTHPYFVKVDADKPLLQFGTTLLARKVEKTAERLAWLNDLREIDWIKLQKRLQKEETYVVDLPAFVSDRLYESGFSFADAKFVLDEALWPFVVRQLVDFGDAGKDPRIALYTKAVIPSGLKGYMHYAPHFIVATNSNVGKTEPFKKLGTVFDRYTPKSIIGAFNERKIQKSPLAYNTRPSVYDQVEGQEKNYEFGAYLLNAQETGLVEQAVGGDVAAYWTASSCIFNANPLHDEAAQAKDRASDLDRLLGQLNKNRAAGRRFAGIVHGTNFKTIRQALDLESYGELVRLFLLVEKECAREILAIWRDPETTVFLHENDGSYTVRATGIIEPLRTKVPLVHGFLYDMITQGETHLRGAALCCAIIDLLPLIKANPRKNIRLVLQRAEEYLGQFEQLNLESFSNLVADGDELRRSLVENQWQELPEMAKPICTAALNYFKANPADNEVSGDAIALSACRDLGDKEKDPAGRTWAKNRYALFRRLEGRDKVNGILRNFGLRVDFDAHVIRRFIQPQGGD